MLADELSDLEKLSLLPISYSRLSTFEMCEAKYFYKNIQKLDDETGAPALLGNVVHSTLENMLSSDRPVAIGDSGEYNAEFDSQVKVYDPNLDYLDEDYLRNGKAMLGEFIERNDGITFPIESKERYFELVIGRGLFRGYIDRIDITNNRAHITDYKTGKREVALSDIPKDLQLGLYALAVDTLYPGIQEVYAELYYLRSGRQKGHLFSKKDLAEVEKELIALVDKIIETDNFNPTKNFWPCKFCSYSTSGDCAVGAMRVNR